MITKSRLIITILLVAAFCAGLALRARVYQPQLADVEDALRSVLAINYDSSIRVEGTPSFQIFPSPKLQLTNAKLSTQNGILLSANRITFGFGIESLIMGSYHISTIDITDADVTLPNSAPVTNTHAAEGLLIAFVGFFDKAQELNAGNLVDTITISNGKLHYGTEPNIFSLNASTAMLRRTRSGTLSVSANLDAGDNPISIELSVAPNSTDRSQGRATEFSIRNEDLTLTGEGSTALDSNFQFLGSIAFKTKNLKLLNHILPITIAALPQSAGSLSSKARLSFSAVTLSDMRLSIGSSDISGNVIADFATKTPRLTGTLAATSVDLTDFLTTIGVKRDALGNWSGESLPVNIIPDLELDMRLSAEAVSIQDATINSVAVSTLIRNRKAELTLVSANLFDGSISGKIRLHPENETSHYTTETNLSFDAIDLEKAGIALLDSKRISGVTTGQIALNANGSSSIEMVNSLSGAIDVAIENNSITGLDLLSFLHRVEARPVGAVLSIKSGKTTFDQGRIIMKIENGAGQFQTAKLTKYPDLQVRLNGKVDFAKRNFSVTGHALGSSAISSDRSIDLPFSLQGPFDSPDFIPDFTNVIKQSGAIAP